MASAWALAVGVVALVVGVLVWAGRPSAVVRDVAAGMATAQVVDLVGDPDQRFDDAEQWLSVIDDADGCKVERITSAWLYVHILQDDAMVFFDATGRVVCVHESGKLISIGSV